MTSIQNVGRRLPEQFLESIDKQLKLPVGFRMDGSMVSLGEVLNLGTEARLWPELETEQRADITAKRIELQPKFNLGLIGTGTVSKEQAIEEVKSRSRIGLRLIDIENRLLTKLMAEIEENADLRQ
ncbi:MAG: hypothetical protein JST85_01370 [Acidobacteria bacterium]|nr:hypothetical protein [Acidobacteriota bacterium]